MTPTNEQKPERATVSKANAVGSHHSEGFAQDEFEDIPINGEMRPCMDAILSNEDAALGVELCEQTELQIAEVRQMIQTGSPVRGHGHHPSDESAWTTGEQALHDILQRERAMKSWTRFFSRPIKRWNQACKKWLAKRASDKAGFSQRWDDKEGDIVRCRGITFQRAILPPGLKSFDTLRNRQKTG
ncbi:MAG: hypothetical protein M4579_001166 [Chaenotheca gracillima]|nr:MAG: hypothetical protein M4579_001166 [Chaenotheca gracillima]